MARTTNFHPAVLWRRKKTVPWTRVRVRLGGCRSRAPRGCGSSCSTCWSTVVICQSTVEWSIAASTGEYEHRLSLTQEARFPRRDLGAQQTGLNYLIVKPGQREAFAHR